MKFEQRINNISKILEKRGFEIPCLSLFYGKMGISIFFFHFSKYTGEQLYEEHAMKLIESLQEQLSDKQGIGYATGFSGIGAGIEYLSQNGFLEIDTDEILEEIDRGLWVDVMNSKLKNNSLTNGLCGLGQYLFYRVNRRPAFTDEYRRLVNCELILFLVNIFENEEIQQQTYLSDILTFMCRLYTLDICNPKIDRYLDKMLKEFLFTDISDEQLLSMTLAFFRLALIRKETTDIAFRFVNRSIQLLESTENYTEDTTNLLLWLLQCKRLIEKTGTNNCLINRIDSLINKSLIQKEDEFQFDNDNLSLHGCAGLGLALMTISGKCSDEWLDLLM